MPEGSSFRIAIPPPRAQCCPTCNTELHPNPGILQPCSSLLFVVGVEFVANSVVLGVVSGKFPMCGLFRSSIIAALLGAIPLRI